MAEGPLDGILTPADQQKLARFPETTEGALAGARANGTAADVAILDKALAGSPMPLAEGFNPRGVWRCRVIKAGGVLPLTVYKPFRCLWGGDAKGWRFMKITGSQRTSGRFYTESATRLIYVGAAHMADEQKRLYGKDPQQDQVAIVERRGEERIIMMFPEPPFESKLDILVLER